MKEHKESLLLSAFLDGELSPREQGRVEAHLKSCAPCRGELSYLRRAKERLAASPRRAMPPELIASIEGRLRELDAAAAPGILRRLAGLLSLPRVWAPASAFAAVAVAAVVWFGIKGREADRGIPLEALLAAHSRYEAESLVPQGSLAVSNYSDLVTSNGDSQDQEPD